MRITALETLRLAERPNLLFLHVRTDEGLTGLGETFLHAQTVEAYVHEVIAPTVIGTDALAIDKLAMDLTPYVGFGATGAEIRGNSALDIALWDLFGQATGHPIAQLLGGFTRPSIRTYNTCAGPAYIRDASGQGVANFGVAAGDLEDLDAFLNRADELAHSLLSEGITAMKIWPFDIPAEANRGQHISAAELRTALEPFEKIRNAVGDRIDIMVEFHSLWQLVPAMKIARALAPYGTYWHEDPIRMDSLADLPRYASASEAPICASETLAGKHTFRDLLMTNAAGIVMLDIAWCGGLSEAKKIAAMAEAWHLPIAPHDCTGPVVLTASTHLSLNAPNALVQESVRAFYKTWYQDVVTALPPVREGMITVPEGAGLGTRLHDDIDRRFTVQRRTTTKDDL